MEQTPWEKFLAQSTNSIKNYVKKEEEFFVKNIPKNSSVIDIGCADGRIAALLIKNAKRVVGIDIDKSIIEKAKEKFSPIKNAEFFSENCVKIHFKDSEFDFGIFGMNTFGNLWKDKVAALKEAVRITKPNGKIFLSVYSENSLLDRLKSYRNVASIKIIDEKKGVVEIGSSYYGTGKVVSEQFSRNEIEEICRDIGQIDVEIFPLNEISYMYVIRVKK